MRAPVVACLLGLIGQATAAWSATPAGPAADDCLPGIAAAEHRFALPAKLLHAIGLVESGRFNPASGRVTSWPWTINVGGVDHVFASKPEAVKAVADLEKGGIRSIDVGCMQINLMHHPDAFASLDDAFDPWTNTQYGGRFLSALHQEIGNWPRAAAAYHSQTPDIGASYELKVMAIWPLAAQFPDATLDQRARAAGPDPERRYTPEFAAHVVQMRADLAQLAARSGPLPALAAHRSKQARSDDDHYTPEFAAALKAMRKDIARIGAEHPAIAGSKPPTILAGTSETARPGGHRLRPGG